MGESSAYAGLAFRKMHGAGNDFVVLDQRSGGTPVSAALARALGDRHRGVGFDQLAVLSGESGHYRLSFMNTDGSVSGACGNATRCVADWLMRANGVSEVTLTTAAGALRAVREPSGQVAVNMGQPRFEWNEVPLARAVDPASLPLDGAPMALSMGNPHCVHVVDDAETVDLAAIGPMIETDALFPEATNVEFLSLLGADKLRLRVWERGTGITMACGSGACAAGVVAAQKGLTGRRVEIVADGGILTVDWREDGVWLAGPTAHVFDGVLSDDFPGLPL
ncbi:MAG: diaminopimelate epimerase [Rhodobacteraceae bacterium]|nr:diaminopimelate epimerase [Paracoccaceae bacterium]